MTTQEKAINAVRTQIEILMTIHTFETLGFIVEPDSISDSKQLPMNIANRLYAALTSNSDLIYDILDITKPEDKELFDASLLDFIENYTFVTNDLVKSFLFGHHYYEVKNNHADKNEIYIDAWKTDDDTEEGTVIAKVNIKTHDITYLEAAAITDPEVQKLIQEIIASLPTT